MHRSNKITHLLFDFDGTLADSLPLQMSIYNQIADRHGVDRLNPAETDRYRQMNIVEFLKHRKIPLSKLPFLLHEGRRLFKQRVEEVSPVTGMPAVLQAAFSHSFHLGVVTSNDREMVQDFVDKHYQAPFDFVSSELNLFGKAKKLSKLLRRRKLSPESVVYIGDETRDIEAAHANAIACWAVTWGMNHRIVLEKYQPEMILETPDQLLNHVLSLTIQ